MEGVSLLLQNVVRKTRRAVASSSSRSRWLYLVLADGDVNGVWSWAALGVLCNALCVPFQPVTPGPRLAAAVALGTLRAEDRGAAQAPPQSPLRDGGEPGGREGIGWRTPQRAGTGVFPWGTRPSPEVGAAAGVAPMAAAGVASPVLSQARELCGVGPRGLCFSVRGGGVRGPHSCRHRPLALCENGKPLQ